MKFVLMALFLVSVKSYAKLRVTVPTETELTGSSLREGELVTSDDAKTLYLHANSITAPINTPPGVVLPYAGTTAPEGYLLCDGTAVSRTTYADLYAVIGNAFGPGNGTTTFHLPDMGGRFLRGVTSDTDRDPDYAARTAMQTGGNEDNNVGSVQDDAIQGHWHAIQSDLAGGSQVAASTSGSSYRSFTSSSTNYNASKATSVQTHAAYGTVKVSSESRPKNVNMNFIIKY